MPKCLSFHAAYGCRRSGACCSAGWTIPFDAAELSSARRLPLIHGTIDDTGAVAIARQRAGGRCTFLEGHSPADHACELHRVGGHAALPLPCRMFPRQVLHDGRGTFISLSHFCPTAAGMLFEDDGPAAIVDAAAGLTGDGTLDGLDARSAWPPVLRPGILMDLEAFALWEECGVELLTRRGVNPYDALRALSDATSVIDAWAPDSDVALIEAVRNAFAGVAPRTSALRPFDPAVKRWLAARLFGSWIAYQGSALATVVRYLHACHDVFVVELARDRNPREAIRRSDRLIVHESSSQQLATLLNDRT